MTWLAAWACRMGLPHGLAAWACRMGLWSLNLKFTKKCFRFAKQKCDVIFPYRVVLFATLLGSVFISQFAEA